MWILPRTLINQHTLVFAPGTEALTSDSNAASQICARSLMRRSSAPQSNFFSREWKAGRLTRLRFGLICDPSLGQSFLAEWTSSLAVIPANHSQLQESDSAPTTPATSGLPSQTAFEFCDPEPCSLKTSKGTSRWDSPACSAIWKNWVTNRRGEYSVRAKSVRLTNASECSLWPTVTANEDSYRIGGDSQQSKCLSAMARRGEMSWPTAATRDYKGQSGSGRQERKGHPADTLPNTVARYGPPAQGNPSTDGNHRELWPTPDATNANDGTPWEKFHAGMMERRERVKQAVLEGKTKPGSGRSPNLAASVQNPQWATPQTRDNRSGGAERWDDPNRSRNLNDQIATVTKQNAKLNPRWVETLMGLPIGWTMASCATPVTIALTSSGCSETESSLPLPSVPSEPSQPTLQQDVPVAPSVPSLSEIAGMLRHIADLIERITL